MRKISNKMLLFLCGAILTTSLVFGQDHNENDNHVPVGTRSLPLQDHIEQQEMHSKFSQLTQVAVDVENSSFTEEGDAEESVTNHAIVFSSHDGVYHQPYNIGIFGDSVELEDGSIWSVYYGDSYKTRDWLPSDLVVISPNARWFSDYAYRLTNQNTGVSVEVNLTLGPIYNAPCTHRVVGIDYFRNVVCLEDGTVWKMSHLYEGTNKQWRFNDTVIIGVNDGWFSSTRPNILINVSMLNHATGIVIN